MFKNKHCCLTSFRIVLTYLLQFFLKLFEYNIKTLTSRINY